MRTPPWHPPAQTRPVALTPPSARCRSVSGGCPASASTVAVRDSVISNWRGRGIQGELSCSDVTITRTEIAHTSRAEKGGVYIRAPTGAGYHTTLEDCHVHDVATGHAVELLRAHQTLRGNNVTRWGSVAGDCGARTRAADSSYDLSVTLVDNSFTHGRCGVEVSRRGPYRYALQMRGNRIADNAGSFALSVAPGVTHGEIDDTTVENNVCASFVVKVDTSQVISGQTLRFGNSSITANQGPMIVWWYGTDFTLPGVFARNRLLDNTGAAAALLLERSATNSPFASLQVTHNFFVNPGLPTELAVTMPAEGGVALDGSYNWWGSTAEYEIMTTKISHSLSDNSLLLVKYFPYLLSADVDDVIALDAERQAYTLPDGTLAGRITVDSTLLSANGPYVVSGPLSVAMGATLTIEAGTVLYCAQSASLQVDGNLLAVGSAGQRIRMLPLWMQDGNVEDTLPRTHLGCYTDRSARDLDGPSDNMGESMSVDNCLLFCRGHGTQFAGAQGTWCYCGDSYGSYGLSSNQDYCNKACKDAPGEMCGGSWRNSVFALDTNVTHWSGVSFGATAGAGSQLAHVDIKFAGFGGRPAVEVSGGVSPSLDFLHIEDSGGSGVLVTDLAAGGFAMRDSVVRRTVSSGVSWVGQDVCRPSCLLERVVLEDGGRASVGNHAVQWLEAL